MGKTIEIDDDDEFCTMDEEELDLIEQYETMFGETPPVACIYYKVSKRMLKRAIETGKPFNEKDVNREILEG